MAVLVTHKRIMAKTSGGRSIDADLRAARLIGYSRILFMLVGIFEFDFLHIFSLSHCWMFLFAGVRFSFTIDFSQVKQIG